MPAVQGPPLPVTGPVEAFTHPLGMQFVVEPVGWVSSDNSDIQMRRPVLMSTCEITNAQFEQFQPGHVRGKASQGDNQPVSNVTASEAADFCQWLTKNDPSGRKYRLPDIAEWEYAARGGVGYQNYPWGNDIDKSKACYAADQTKPVGSFKPNKFGTYDMAGNVAEWVTTDDVPEWQLRGGSWRDGASAVTIASRGKLPAEGEVLDHHGFRVLCEPPVLK